MGLELTPLVLVVLGLAAFLIGLAKGGLAGGLGPFITVLVSTVVPPTVAIGVLLPLLMLGDLAAVWVHRRDWSREAMAAMLPAAAVAVVVTSLFLGAASDRLVEIVLGVLSIGFVLHRLLQPRVADAVARTAPSRGLAAVAGGVAGTTSTIAHAGGPVISIYLLAAGLPPVRFAATAAVFFLVVNAMKVPGYLAVGLLDASMLRVLPLGLLIVPGTLAGRWLVHRVDARTFERIILVLLTAGGINLLLG